MKFEENKSLKEFNTFGINVKARYFISVSSIPELKEAIAKNPHTNLFVLGGGSNILLTKNIDALVIHLNTKGISILKEENDTVSLQVSGGENWHQFVLYCIKNNYAGVENMSLIPGNIGTAPIQNIGAYGVELKDVFESCSALEIESLTERTFNKEECHFGYRSSIFKKEKKGAYIITDVTFRLKTSQHQIMSNYGAIKQLLTKRKITKPTIKDISDIIIAIRQSKLPDPTVLGNSGSFFKNPIISLDRFLLFKEQFPEAPFYEVSTTQFKIPAGWLIEQAGFKGKRYGNAGIHKNQALVLVNHGNASGQEIWNLALKIQERIQTDFNIYIEPEVNII